MVSHLANVYLPEPLAVIVKVAPDKNTNKIKIQMKKKRTIIKSIVAIFTISFIFQIQYIYSQSNTIETVKSELDNRVKEDKFSGVVLIAKDSKVIFQQAYGYSDRDTKRPNSIDTKFRFGSMGKMFTGVAIMQLVQEGKVNLEDTIGSYLTDYPNKEVSKVTIHQLLTHTGGTGDVFGPEFEHHRLELKELMDYVALYGVRGLLFAPGSKHEYSNYGYILLGRIIEVISGMSYDKYVHEHIFTVAGMNSTDNLPENIIALDTSIALPYTTRNPMNEFRTALDFLPYRGTSAGGGYTTAEDLLKFDNALFSYKLLSQKYTEMLTTGKVNTPMPGLKYAYGFEERNTPDGIRSIGHGGGAPGMNGSFTIFPNTGYTIIVLANIDPPAADEIGKFIIMQLLKP
jgi:D-alanyl-D-alanine carboxypeptidase